MNAPITRALPEPPDGLTTRALSMADVPAVTELLAAWERAEPADHSYTETDIREELSAPGSALDDGSVVVLDGEHLIAYSVLYVIAREPEWVAFSDGGVHPRAHRRGIGGWLVRRQIEQARALAARQAPGLPAQIRVGVPQSRPGPEATLTGAGFTTRRYFFRMRADLDDRNPPALADPAGVLIRPYRDADEEAARLVSNAAFADHWGSKPRDADAWRAECSGSESFRPGASFVAVSTADPASVRAGEPGFGGGNVPGDPGTMVGFVLATEYDADTAQRGHRTGYVARVGTVRSARGQGIGSVLVARSMAAMREQGCAVAELDVDADSPTGAGRIYQRLGFEVVARDRLLALSI